MKAIERLGAAAHEMTSNWPGGLTIIAAIVVSWCTDGPATHALDVVLFTIFALAAHHERSRWWMWLAIALAISNALAFIGSLPLEG